jgi:hypothetical protein
VDSHGEKQNSPYKNIKTQVSKEEMEEIEKFYKQFDDVLF